MTRPRPGTPGHYANLVFRRRVLSKGEQRGSTQYHAAIDGLPGWATTGFPGAGDIVGVYENVNGSPRDALLFCDDRLCVVSEDGTRISIVVEYRDIAEWLRFSKEPVAGELAVVMRDGRTVTVPIYGRQGAVGSLATFIGGAAHRARKGTADNG